MSLRKTNPLPLGLLKLTGLQNSDTAASALANVLYFLIVNPHVFRELQRILDDAFPGGDADFDLSHACEIPLLEGIIYETLRLKPSVPGGLARITPPEGPLLPSSHVLLPPRSSPLSLLLIPPPHPPEELTWDPKNKNQG